VATFIDTNQSDYQSFKERFFSQYHVVPDLQAFLGYDMIRWITFTLVSKGKNGMIEPGSAWDKGLATGFEIKPVFRTNGTTNTDKSPMYYENARIRILKYEGQDFHLVR
ncbi:MAG TPA: hypothetical protein VJ508_20695, partial [Saprospiraceae bacterium]|nr:hypothetical protein [Saprospiraceae bacterium]